MRDGDQIYAVIRGFAANNDGSAKVGYTAPSVEGQARVIALAQARPAWTRKRSVTSKRTAPATPLGDPDRTRGAHAGLWRARSEQKEQFCAVGTAKTNVGHLDIAAGVTGLIHASHIVRHGVFPPTLHFKKPNPKFDLGEQSLLRKSWRGRLDSNDGPRRAGVSAFGVGGTNAHVILEQAPERIAAHRR